MFKKRQLEEFIPKVLDVMVHKHDVKDAEKGQIVRFALVINKVGYTKDDVPTRLKGVVAYSPQAIATKIKTLYARAGITESEHSDFLLYV